MLRQLALMWHITCNIAKLQHAYHFMHYSCHPIRYLAVTFVLNVMFLNDEAK